MTTEKTLHESKWIRLLEYDYTTPEGITKSWELAQRTTRAGSTDAVDILAIMKQKGKRIIVLVKQFRPPLKGWTIEMPAGLVDPNETIQTTAARELKEETGYQGRVVRKPSPIVASDPGITDANLQLVEVEIDGDDPINQNPKPDIEDANIETLLVDLETLQEKLDEFSAEGLHVDSRLYHFAAGLSFAKLCI